MIYITESVVQIFLSRTDEMNRLSILLVLSITPFAISQCTVEKARWDFRRSVYEFSIKLLSRINEESEGHFVASTLSPWSLLTILSMGAADNTFAELTQVAGLSSHDCFNNKYLDIFRQVTASEPQATLERSSALFIDSSLDLKDTFRKRIVKTGVCDITPISLKSFAAAAGVINNYVKQATHNIIEEIVSASDLEGIYFILIDALYFKGAWTTSFSSDETETSTFYDSKSNALGDVNLMFTTNEFNYTSLDQINAKVIELPYGNGEHFSMLVFLPYEDVSVHTVIESLNKISLTSIFNLFNKYGPVSVMLSLPRFKITTDIDYLKELLTDMGLKDMFDSSRARFPDISDYNIHVSSFIQKADIEVTEEGTVAAAATLAGITFRSSGPPEFLANKPFLFMVVDRRNQVPIFSGVYSKPSLY